MTSKQTIESLFKVCIEKIITYCCTHSIYKYTSLDYAKVDPYEYLSKFLNLYIKKYMTVFETNQDILIYKYFDEDEYQDVVDQFMDIIEVISDIRHDDRNNVENMLTACLDEIKLLHTASTTTMDEIKAGVCCFCEGDCNPMSQSCGSCSRGISGASIGLPVPDHLRKFL